MKHLTLTLLFSCALFLLHAQVSDNFTDGNFTADPTWIGDDSLFRIVSGELKLNGTLSADAHLVTDHNLLDSTAWTFLCRFDLSPSTQNFCRFYLTSDQENLEGPLNGYYIQLGGVTGNTDSITLYRQNGIARTRVIGGRPGTVAKSTNKVRIKVLRDNWGNWELYSDTAGGKAYILEGTGFDNNGTAGNYLGWCIKYTAGNSQKYYLDDVNANKPVADNTAPLVDHIAVNGKSSLSVFFSEPTEAASAQNSTHYAVSPAIGNPVSATLVNEQEVLLEFGNSFLPGTPYIISIQQVKDEAGNTMIPEQKNFRYDASSAHDLLISEFMPDPTPANGLPEQEFVELYNNTEHPVNLTGFTIGDGGMPAVFPDVTIGADSFIIVCSQTASAFFAPYGKLAVVSGMPSLNNAGDQIILKDKDGTVIHQLAYDLSWYQDATKDDGGYTIELNYLEQLCKGKQVYAASRNPLGGTPGSVNSVWDLLNDTVAPGISSASALQHQQLLVLFNENTDISSFSVSAIALQPAVSISSIQVISTDSLLIKLQAPLQNNTSYRLLIHGVKDCSGNIADLQNDLDYYVPENASNYDVLIHEIMADPDPAQQLPNAEYIELYNRSAKVISLKNWTLGDDGGFARLPDIILLPDSFIIITSTGSSSLFTEKVIGVPGFPSLGNDGDNLVLKNEAGQVIHAVYYTSAWHADGFKKQGGFSLEMIDAGNPCGQKNWKSCAHKTGGTPGAVNSVKGSNKDLILPRLLRAYAIDSNHVRLSFTEPLDSVSFRLSRFVLNETENPVTISGMANQYESVMLQFSTSLSYRNKYTIVVDRIQDCAGNYIQDYRSVDFERPYLADSGDLIINELLFNSRSGAYDFVELYNKSNKPIDIKNLVIARRDADYSISEIHGIASSGFVIGAEEYAVITPDAASLQQNYFCKDPSMLISATLPAYSDDKGFVVLMDQAGVIYDELVYDEKMHIAWLDNKDGVSLERIDAARATNDRTNWTSAAASAGYATPTCKNSQHLQTEWGAATLQLQPSTISPDGDGYQDVININYRFNEQGYTGNLFIYDAGGRVVKQLFKNNLMGTTGTYTWDGTTDNGNKAAVGIYLFRLEAFNLNGDVKKEDAIGVVAGKL